MSLPFFTTINRQLVRVAPGPKHTTTPLLILTLVECQAFLSRPEQIRGLEKAQSPMISPRDASVAQFRAGEEESWGETGVPQGRDRTDQLHCHARTRL